MENDIIEMCAFKVCITSLAKDLYVCFVYKHPKACNSKSIDELCVFLRVKLNIDPQEFLVIIGDFNIDAKDQVNNRLLNMFEDKLKVKSALGECKSTIDRGTCIDWCLSIIRKDDADVNFNAQIYETLFSYHKAIIFFFGH